MDALERYFAQGLYRLKILRSKIELDVVGLEESIAARPSLRLTVEAAEKFRGKSDRIPVLISSSAAGVDMTPDGEVVVGLCKLENGLVDEIVVLAPSEFMTHAMLCLSSNERAFRILTIKTTVKIENALKDHLVILSAQLATNW